MGTIYIASSSADTLSSEPKIGSTYKDLGFVHRDQILSGLVSTFPVILDKISLSLDVEWTGSS